MKAAIYARYSSDNRAMRPRGSTPRVRALRATLRTIARYTRQPFLRDARSESKRCARFAERRFDACSRVAGPFSRDRKTPPAASNHYFAGVNLSRSRQALTHSTRFKGTMKPVLK